MGVLAAVEALSPQALAKLLPASHKVSAKALLPVLEECVENGTFHRIPPATAKGKPRYWHADVMEYGNRAIIKALGSKGPQTAANLKKAAKGLSDVQFRQVFDSLVGSRAVHRHPPLGKSRKELFGSRPPSPEKYLQEIGTQLTKIVGQLTAANVPRDELRRALVQIAEAAGIPFSGQLPRDGASTVTQPALVDLIALMKSIEPRAERGALVGSRDLRRAARLDKAAFDRAVLELARQGRVSLHRHDYAGGLSPTEQDELVTDGAGKYYAGIALRRA